MMEMSLSFVPRMEMRQESIFQGALRLYGASQKILVDVPLGKRRFSVTAALVKTDDLGSIFSKERFAGTIGGMFFITQEMPERYRHFAAFHELAEHAAPQGFDVTGLAKHFQAIAVELGYAKATLSPEEFRDYVTWRKRVERTKFFQLEDNGLIDGLASRIQEIFKSLPQYLTYRKKQLVELVEDSP